MEEKHVSIADAAQFVRDIISIGGVFKVDPNSDFITDITGGAATVQVGKEDKPIMVWSEKAKIGNHVLLNIFGETMNTTEERRWFYSFLNMIPGKILRDMMMTIINKATDKDDKDAYAAMEVIAPFVKEIDDKTKTEFNLLGAADIACIIFHKPKKTAQLQTKLFEEDFRASFGKKIRAKSWKLFENMFKTLMNIESEEQLSADFKAEAMILGMKQTDAMVRVLVKFIENVDAYSRTLLGTDYPIGNLLIGIQNLNLYYAVMRVFTSGGAQQVDKKAPVVSPFGGKQVSAGGPTPIQSKQHLVSLGSAYPVAIPDVVGNNPKPINLGQTNAIISRMPDVVNLGANMAVQTMPYNQPSFGMFNQPSSFGKPIAIDNPATNRSQGPRVRQILSNGKIV